MHFNSEDDYRTRCGNDSPCQQQSYKLSFGYVSTGATQRPGKTLQKTAKRQGKIEETWVGTRQAQKLKLNFFYLFVYLFIYLFIYLIYYLS